MVIETLISEAMKANALAQTEGPVVQSFATNQNAQAFKVFCEAAGVSFNGDIDAAVNAFTKFCSASNTK